MSLEEAQEVLSLNETNLDPDLKYLELALRACRQGTERAHVVDGRMEGAILREIFSNLGVGTMVFGNDYESIRPLRATDIGDVLRLMQPLMEEGILIHRTEDDTRVPVFPAFRQGELVAVGADLIAIFNREIRELLGWLAHHRRRILCKRIGDVGINRFAISLQLPIRRHRNFLPCRVVVGRCFKPGGLG